MTGAVTNELPLIKKRELYSRSYILSSVSLSLQRPVLINNNCDYARGKVDRVVPDDCVNMTFTRMSHILKNV